MISYKPLQKLLIDYNIKKTELMKGSNISSATMAKLNTNEYVSVETLDKICNYLKERKITFKMDDIIEHI